MEPRGLNSSQAAKYIGVSLGTLKRHGPSPIKIGNRKVYDRIALDVWFDSFSGSKGSVNRDELLALEALNGSR